LAEPEERTALEDVFRYLIFHYFRTKFKNIMQFFYLKTFRFDSEMAAEDSEEHILVGLHRDHGKLDLIVRTGMPFYIFFF
jgi:hypothetical protein